MLKRAVVFPFLFLILVPLGLSAVPPNVILIVADDQGYGDLGCHGNPVIQTPALDRLYRESIRLTQFHVDPTCSPSMAALMTGRYSSRTGVWHTVQGRSLLRRDEVTMADLFAGQGYRTGIFGKWHLGDNYPFRPQERGFQEVLIHSGGGVGQTPDYWGNDYFDDTYLHNGQLESFQGYCTDVFFNAALRFIEKNRDHPFFAYLATNVPHDPFLVDDKYSLPYREEGVEAQRAAFYGMITSLDENVGRLLGRLRELGLEGNTILIFMTDNGTSFGDFSAGMRGQKGSEYEGGHHVPFFIRWPEGLPADRDVSRLAAHIDVLPTLVELCGLTRPGGVALDGKSLVPLLRGAKEWPERVLFVQSHRIEHPQPWRKSAVMTDRYRLVNGVELYDINSDPGQVNDLTPRYPEVVLGLRQSYEKWYADVSTRFGEYCRIILGSDRENPSRLTCHDWHGEHIPWRHEMIREAPEVNGFWAVEIARKGRYAITLRQEPLESNAPINAVSARLKIGDLELDKAVPPGATTVSFELDLEAGEAELQTWFREAGGKSRGAFFVYVERQ